MGEKTRQRVREREREEGMEKRERGNRRGDKSDDPRDFRQVFPRVSSTESVRARVLLLHLRQRPQNLCIYMGDRGRVRE